MSHSITYLDVDNKLSKRQGDLAGTSGAREVTLGPHDWPLFSSRYVDMFSCFSLQPKLCPDLSVAVGGAPSAAPLQQYWRAGETTIY